MTLLLRKEAFARFKISYCPIFRVGGEWVATVQWHEKTDPAVKEQELEGRTEGETEGGGSHTATLKWKCKCHFFYGIEWWELRKAFNYVTLVDDLRPLSLGWVATKGGGDMFTPLLSFPSRCFHSAMEDMLMNTEIRPHRSLCNHKPSKVLLILKHSHLRYFTVASENGLRKTEGKRRKDGKWRRNKRKHGRLTLY